MNATPVVPETRLGSPVPAPDFWPWMLLAAAALAVVPSALLAVNVPPSATFLNQAAAVIGWGLFGVVLAWRCAPARGEGRHRPRRGLVSLLWALGLMVAACAASCVLHGLPLSLGLSAIGLMAAAGLLAVIGAATMASGGGPAAFRALCIALVLAGVLSAVVGMVQVFAPAWADGRWIAITASEGRAAGNLRQPNHLSSLLLWSLIAALWLSESAPRTGRARFAAGLWMAGMFALVFGLALSSSRTGMLGVLALAVWGALDRKLSPRSRWLLCLSPVVYALCWLGLTAWADSSGHVFGGAVRLRSEADISSSRFAIWRDTWSLIGQHPWFGVGWSEFNLVWSLTPFPGRPVAFFDHSHNLLLQWLVELGTPLALAVTALFAHALWRGWYAGRPGATDRERERSVLVRSAWMMVLLVAWHSLLEYPLWYAYFLLPTAFAWGLCLGAPRPAAAPTAPRARPSPPRPSRPGLGLLTASLLMTAGGVASVVDYLPVVAIFEPEDGAPPLAERIDTGRHSLLFSHHADYAAATTGTSPPEVLRAMDGAKHFLLDTRLMIAWANALAAVGQTDAARHIAARLREFRNPAAAAFFAPCASAPSPGAEPPFQCVPPTAVLGADDFR